MHDSFLRNGLTTIYVLSKFAYKYTSSLHCYSLYSITMSSTNDVRVVSGESACSTRERRLQRRRERERAHRAS